MDRWAGRWTDRQTDESWTLFLSTNYQFPATIFPMWNTAEPKINKLKDCQGPLGTGYAIYVIIYYHTVIMCYYTTERRSRSVKDESMMDKKADLGQIIEC